VNPLRRGLDTFYTACGGLAAVFLLIMLVIIVAQMVARWSGNTFPGSTDYAGYCMAAASFFAFAYALNHGAHIRVNLLLSRLGAKRRWGELWCFGIGAALATYFAFYAIKATYWSYKLNDISQGQDAWPLWIPQIPMAFGTSVLALAMTDHFLRILFFGIKHLGDESLEDHHVE
jgi:TRAP-type C4-dicarboxylate transport system permease small subunit